MLDQDYELKLPWMQWTKDGPTGGGRPSMRSREDKNWSKMKTETLNTQKLRTFVRFFLLKDEPAQPLFKKKKKKKRTICTHHKGHLRWLSQQNPSALCFNCPWTRHCSSPSGSGGNFLKLLHCGEEHIIVPPLFSRWYKECVIWIYIILRAAAKPLNINSFDSSRAQIQAEGRVLISYTVVSLSFSPALLCSSHTLRSASQ